MVLDTAVLDRALEWLIPKIGTIDDVVMNEESGEDINSLQALCVWCLRLRYNLVEHNRNKCLVENYPTWYGYRYTPSCNIYSVISKIAKQFIIEGGTVPDYSNRSAKDISNWTYKRILGPDKFIPMHFNVNELWRAVCRMFPNMISQNDIIEDDDELEFEMYNQALANLAAQL